MSGTIQQDYDLLKYLKEIERVTDLNGCYFINIKDNFVIESTIPFKVPEAILWEISVLRDTFTQFSEGINHGALNELMIQGDKGYILLYDLNPQILLLAMGSYEINLSYVKLAMIDILKRIKKRIDEIGDQIINIPRKELGPLGKVLEEAPQPIAKQEVSTPPTESPIQETPPEIDTGQKEPVSVQKPEAIPTTGVSTETTETEPQQPLETDQIPVKPSEQQDIKELTRVNKIVEKQLKNMIASIEDKDVQGKYDALKTIFQKLKSNLANLTGKQLNLLLEQLKDVILMNIGTSLTLYDISKASQELDKIESRLSAGEVKSFKNRIDNWVSRIIK